MLVHGGHASARRFFTGATAPGYDSVVRVTTFDRDAAWKRKMLGLLAGRHGQVLDLACGTGILSSTIKETGRQVVGLDLSSGYLRMAKQRLGPVFAQGTAEMLPYRDGTFDAAVSSYLAKYVDANATVAECLRVLAPGGIAIFHDFTYPESRAMRGLWSTYLSILRLAGVFARSWKPVFDELGGVIRDSLWTDDVVQAMKDQGFQDVKCRRYTLGTAAIVWGSKP